MWKFERILEYPVEISKPDPKFANLLISQIGSFAGELGACLRYINQSYTMPDNEGKMLLIEIGTEEMAHLEILSNMMLKLIKGLSFDEIKQYGLDKNYTEHGFNFFPTDTSGVPFSSTLYAVTGDPIADLNEDLAAESKARAVYEHLMNLTNNDEILKPLSFLRQREIIHYQRFKELLDKYEKTGVK